MKVKKSIQIRSLKNMKQWKGLDLKQNPKMIEYWKGQIFGENSIDFDLEKKKRNWKRNG